MKPLIYFNRSTDITIQTDTSKHNLDEAPMQGGKLVAFASKSLADVESCYTNIERELITVIFNMKKFYTYMDSCFVIIKSDHKPAASPGFQEMVLQLQEYDFKIICRSGKDMGLANRFSHFPSTTECSQFKWKAIQKAAMMGDTKPKSCFLWHPDKTVSSSNDYKDSYITGKIYAPPNQPCSYLVENYGYLNCCTWHHILAMDCNKSLVLIGSQHPQCKSISFQDHHIHIDQPSTSKALKPFITGVQHLPQRRIYPLKPTTPVTSQQTYKINLPAF